MSDRVPGAMLKHLRTISTRSAIEMLVRKATAYQLGAVTDLDDEVADATRQVQEVLVARGVDRATWLGVIEEALQLRLRVAGLPPSAPAAREATAAPNVQRRVDYFAATLMALRAL